jgi:hypothetical protein
VATLSYWPSVANAINNGISGLRGPSQIIVATAGAGTSSPIARAPTRSRAARTAPRDQRLDAARPRHAPAQGHVRAARLGASVAMLSDCDDSTTWSTQASFGLAEGVYMICTGPSADSIANAIAVKATAGIDSYAFKLMLGDWVYILDTVNGQTRLVSPQGFVAGVLGNLPRTSRP